MAQENSGDWLQWVKVKVSHTVVWRQVYVVVGSSLTTDYKCSQGRNHVFKVGVQFHITEQNTDAIPSFVHCSVLRNGNHTLHQKSCGGPSTFWGSGPLLPPQWLRP